MEAREKTIWDPKATRRVGKTSIFLMGGLVGGGSEKRFRGNGLPATRPVNEASPQYSHEKENRRVARRTPKVGRERLEEKKRLIY